MVSLYKVGAIALTGTLSIFFFGVDKAQSQAVNSLPNGNYMFCAPVESVPEEMRDYQNPDCFLFRKTGNRIVGEVRTDTGGDLIHAACITGVINGNTITGQALYAAYGSMGEPVGERLQTVEFDSWLDTDLQVRRGTWVQSFVEPIPEDLNHGESGATWRIDWIRYNSALLDLSDYRRTNLGPVPPPSACTVSSTGRAVTPPRPY